MPAGRRKGQSGDPPALGLSSPDAQKDPFLPCSPLSVRWFSLSPFSSLFGRQAAEGCPLPALAGRQEGEARPEDGCNVGHKAGTARSVEARERILGKAGGGEEALSL